MLQSTGLQRVRHDLATEKQQQNEQAVPFHVSRESGGISGDHLCGLSVSSCKIT